LNIRSIMQRAPIIPVMVVDDLDHAVPLAEALVAGGLSVLEITLRTDIAFAALKKIADEVPDALVGVGTITAVEQVQKAIDHGAQFAVSPGYTHELGHACAVRELPFLPGVMTPADIIRAEQDGLNSLKFFPAEQAGGIKFLKALAGPFPDVVFCPTGGVSKSNYQEYLALDNVLCAGGSWVAPQELVRAKNWQSIQELAKQCEHPASA